LGSSITVFEFAFLILYALLLVFLSIYGGHRYYLAYLYKKHKGDGFIPKGKFDEAPVVTIQLPMYNEMYVAERLIDATCGIRHAEGKLEIQVLDDSTDDTVDVVKRAVARWQAKGVDIKYIHRSNRHGYKAGALEEGLAVARGLTPTSFPSLTFSRRQSTSSLTTASVWCRSAGTT
jgi:cellulose synthase/poly-beta-1,6-N-acetylglucosamine synthase-like glycosyltransferase